MQAVLIATVGTSPEILTEMLWELGNRGIEVSRTYCIGTQRSVEAYTQTLEAPNAAKGTTIGALARLRTALDKPETWPCITWPGMVDIDDVRTAEEALRLDKACRQVLLAAQQEAGPAPVFACISGGRKTMSASLMQAVSLLGREQDKTFHVLVRSKSPADLSEHSITSSAFAFPGDIAFPRSQEVELDLVEAPIVRLRDLLMYEGISFTDEAVIGRLQKALELPTLRLDVSRRIVFLERNGKYFRVIRHLQPKEALLMAASILAGAPSSVTELQEQAREVIRRWWDQDMDAPSVNMAQIAEFFLHGVPPVASRLRSKLAKALQAFDPRVASYFEFKKGLKQKGVNPRTIGFSSEALERVKLIPPDASKHSQRG